MNGEAQVALTVIIGTLLLLVMIGSVVLLLVLNNNRRNRHRAELAELNLEREQAVIQAEREATHHTLRDVARELHDNVGQLLTVVQMGLNTALEEVGGNGRLAAARDTLDQGVEEVRRLGHTLNSDIWRERTLVDAITAEAQRIERVGRIHVLLSVKGSFAPQPADTRIILFRAFQEILNNVLKHSRADTLEITITGQGSPTIIIADNGRGFDPDLTQGNGGLVNIRQRCRLVGYSAECRSAPGNGCVWHLTPLNNDGA
jgi:signal transduction histidine kinase